MKLVGCHAGRALLLLGLALARPTWADGRSAASRAKPAAGSEEGAAQAPEAGTAREAQAGGVTQPPGKQAPEVAAVDPGAVREADRDGKPLPHFELWAGHQITVGKRDAPFVGFVKTRTEHFFLAKVERRGDEIRVTPTACKVEIAPAAGVAVRFPPGAPARMPKVTTVWHVGADGSVSAQPWVMEWKDEDVDKDGEPGVTMLVDAPMCDGRVFMGAWNKTWAEAEPFEGGLKGRVKIRSVETFLGADAFCLRIAGRNDSHTVTGTFKFLPVKDGLTCQDLLDAGWPVRADEPDAR